MCWDKFECHEGHNYAYEPDNTITNFPDGLEFCDKANFGHSVFDCSLNLGADSKCSALCWVQRWLVRFANMVAKFFEATCEPLNLSL